VFGSSKRSVTCFNFTSKNSSEVSHTKSRFCHYFVERIWLLWVKTIVSFKGKNLMNAAKNEISNLHFNCFDRSVSRWELHAKNWESVNGKWETKTLVIYIKIITWPNCWLYNHWNTLIGLNFRIKFYDMNFIFRNVVLKNTFANRLMP